MGIIGYILLTIIIVQAKKHLVETLDMKEREREPQTPDDQLHNFQRNIETLESALNAHLARHEESSSWLRLRRTVPMVTNVQWETGGGRKDGGSGALLMR